MDFNIKIGENPKSVKIQILVGDLENSWAKVAQKLFQNRIEETNHPDLQFPSQLTNSI